jgi:hypothetical protein
MQEDTHSGRSSGAARGLNFSSLPHHPSAPSSSAAAAATTAAAPAGLIPYAGFGTSTLPPHLRGSSGSLGDQGEQPGVPLRTRYVETDAEPLLRDNDERYCLFPIKYQDVWQFYRQAVASFWTTDEVDLSQDMRDWRALTDDERHFISYVLAFFASSDGIVLENLGVRFMQDVQVRGSL